MAKARIGVDAEYLKKDKEKILENLKLLWEELAGIEEELSELSTMWDGTAKQTFMQQVLADQKEMQDFCDKIYGLLGCIAYAEQQYRKCENQIGELVLAMKL